MKKALLLLFVTLMITGCSKKSNISPIADKSELYGEWFLSQNKVTYNNLDGTPYRSAYILEDPKPTNHGATYLISESLFIIKESWGGIAELKYKTISEKGKKYVILDWEDLNGEVKHQYSVSNGTLVLISEELDYVYNGELIPKKINTITLGKIN